MLWTRFLSYLKNGSRLNAIHSRNVTFSAICSCKAETIGDDLHEPRRKEAVGNRPSSNKYPHSSKSVLSELGHNVTIRNRLSSNKYPYHSSESVLFNSEDYALSFYNSCDSCDSVEEVLTYLRNNPKIQCRLYASTFETIFRLYKSGKSNLSLESVCRTREFELLSENVNRDVRFLSVIDAVTILKVLTYFGISTSSTLCQSLLQRISKHINKLEIIELSFLYFILGKTSPSPLVESLKRAIPMVFEAHVHSHLDKDDTSKLSFAVRFAFRQNLVTAETRSMLVDMALEKIDHFKVSEAFEMIRALFFRPYSAKDNMIQLYKKLQHILTKNMNQLNSVQIYEIVNSSISKYLVVDELLFDENLVKTSIKYFIEHEISLEETGKLLRQLARVSYYCPDLLDYYDSQLKLYADTIDCSNICVTYFIKSCSDCTYKPKNWNLYERKILSFLEREIKQNDRITWIIGMVINLFTLECFPETLVHFCFKNDTFHQNLSTDSEGSTLDLINMLRMYYVVKLLYSDRYDGSDPPTDILERAVALRRIQKKDSLLGALQVGLGGTQYVLNGVTTKLGQMIEYLIVKRRSGEIYPLNTTEIVGSSDLSYESLNLPEDSYSVAIVLHNPSSYCLDGYRLRGKMKIDLQCLEAYGISTVPVCHYRWSKLGDAEKTTYLINKINQSVPVTSSFKRSNENC